MIGILQKTHFLLQLVLKSSVTARRDAETPEGRARERQRRARLTAAMSAFAKLISVSVGFITVPIVLKYLGQERYGIWMTINSLFAMMAFADFGIGNGILNSITKLSGKDDLKNIQAFVSSGCVALLFIAVAFCLLLIGLHRSFDWASFFNVQSPIAVAETGPAILVFFTIVILNIPFGITQRVQLALQSGYLTGIWQSLGAVLGLFSVLLVVWYEAGLPWLVAALMGGQLITVVINGWVFFFKTNPDLRPKLKLARIDAMRGIIHTGMLFFILQIVAALTSASDNIIISRIIGPEAVTQFAIPEKMFSLITVILSMALGPLWPAYGEAISRGDQEWVRQTFKKSVVYSILISFFLSSIVVIFNQPLLNVWGIGNRISPSTCLLTGFAAWKIMEAVCIALAMLLNGANIVKIQVIISITAAFSFLTLKITAATYFGIEGLIWSASFVALIFVILPYLFLIRRIINKL